MNAACVLSSAQWDHQASLSLLKHALSSHLITMSASLCTLPAEMDWRPMRRCRDSEKNKVPQHGGPSHTPLGRFQDIYDRRTTLSVITQRTGKSGKKAYHNQFERPPMHKNCLVPTYPWWELGRVLQNGNLVNISIIYGWLRCYPPGFIAE